MKLSPYSVQRRICAMRVALLSSWMGAEVYGTLLATMIWTNSGWRRRGFSQ